MPPSELALPISALFALQKQHKDQAALFPWRSANEQGAVCAEDGVTFDQNLLLAPDLKVQIDTALGCGAFGVDLHEEIAGWNDPRFVFAKDVLLVLTEDFEMLEGKYFGYRRGFF